jgi:large subunit ribosomal protein L5
LPKVQDIDGRRRPAQVIEARGEVMARLQEQYRTKIVPSLREKLGRENVHSLPKLTKIVVSMGAGKASQDRKHLDEVIEHLAQITGQMPQRTRARKAIAAFRLREGMEVGCRVTLRGKRMYEFLDRLIALALPRVRDFRGLNPNGFDGRGNYSLGLNEQLVFPEINADQVHFVQGMNITFVTTARNNDEGRLLMRELGLPLQKES